MKLRSKVIWILVLMWSIIFLIILMASNNIIISKFTRLELKSISSDINSVVIAFNDLKSSFKILSSDWGLWDDSYTFMQNKNPGFISDNFDRVTFHNAKLNLIFFYDTQQKFYFGKYFNLEKDQFEPIPQTLLEAIQKNNILKGINDTHTNSSGIIDTPKGFLIYSVSSVLRSNGTGPIKGMLVMGYYLNQKHVQELSEVLQLPLTFYDFKKLPSFISPLIIQTILRGENYIQLDDSSNSGTMNAFIPIKDSNQKTIGILKISEQRNFHREVITTIQYFLSIIISLAIIVSILVWYLLKYFVLNRIISVSNQLAHIRQEAKFSERIFITGKDELNDMVYALNDLLELVELTQEQLTTRISQRTEKLDRLVGLNKNLFLEVHKQKSLEFKMQKNEEFLKQIAYYDSLTGLPNRMFFYELLEKNIEKSKTFGTGFAVMFLDVDRFKEINDTYGHEAGDVFLKYVANKLKQIVKSSDVVARLAGDEFIVLLNNVKEKVVIDLIAEKILASISEPFVDKNFHIHSSFSIGISIFPEDGKTREELLRSADLAMYFAKNKNGNTYYYSKDIQKKEK